MLPNFICPGAMKSGTTTLYRLLKQHPDIYLPRKEIRFFASENWHKGFNWYQSLFENYGGQKITGEITPQYMYYPEAVKHIHELLGPDIKFVFLLRNPVKRAYSDYRMHQRVGLYARPFEEFIAGDAPLPKDLDFLNKGLYAQQIERFLSYYPIENMKFVIFEEFIGNQEQALKEIFDFLGVDRDVPIQYELHENPDFVYKHPHVRKMQLRLANFIQKYVIRTLYRDKDTRIRKYSTLWRNLVRANARSDKEAPKPAPGLLEKLSAYYRDDIEALSSIIGRDLAVWGQSDISQIEGINK